MSYLFAITPFKKVNHIKMLNIRIKNSFILNKLVQYKYKIHDGFYEFHREYRYSYYIS